MPSRLSYVHQWIWARGQDAAAEFIYGTFFLYSRLTNGRFGVTFILHLPKQSLLCSFHDFYNKPTSSDGKIEVMWYRLNNRKHSYFFYPPLLLLMTQVEITNTLQPQLLFSTCQCPVPVHGCPVIQHVWLGMQWIQMQSSYVYMRCPSRISTYPLLPIKACAAKTSRCRFCLGD